MALHQMNFVASISILDRGDGPAQEVLTRTARNRAQRQQDETRDELNKINDRVSKTLNSFDVMQKAEEDAKKFKDPTMAYVNDLDELRDILNDNIKKRKYQQQVTVFIVGYQNTCVTRLKLMQQVHDFFNEAPQRWEEEELNPATPEIDLEEASHNITESLETAKDLTNRIADLNREMVDYMYQYANAKAGNKNKKKLEKALSQAKDDIQLMSEKLLAAQKELEDKDEKIQTLYRQVEVKSMEMQKYKSAAEIAKKSMQEANASQDQIDSKDKEVKDLKYKMEMMQLELAQKESSRESTQKELLMSGRENMLKVRELEDKLNVINAENQAQIRDLTDFHDRQIKNLSSVHRSEVAELKKSYEDEMAKLRSTNDKLRAEIQDLGLKYVAIENERAKISGDLTEARSGILYLRDRESTLLSEKESLTHQISELKTAQSFRTASASSRTSDTFKSEIEQDTRSKASTKKKTKEGTDSVKSTVTDLETNAVPPPQARPVEPEPAEVKLPDDFTNEEKWSSYPMVQAQSAFAQYRDFTQKKVKNLEDDLVVMEKKAARRVNTLKAQFHEHKGKWKAERLYLVKQLELSVKHMGEAEADADVVLAQLEEFVDEAEQLEKEEESNALMRFANMSARSMQTSEVASKKSTTSTDHTTPVPDNYLLQQTDDAKSTRQVSAASTVRGKSTSGQPLMQVTGANGTADQSPPELPGSAGLPRVASWDPSDVEVFAENQKGRRSVTFSQQAGEAEETAASSRSKSISTENMKIMERIVRNLKLMMVEESLDIVQQNALHDLKSALKTADHMDTDYNEYALVVFGLASQLLSESVFLGYKPENLFTQISSLYSKALQEYTDKYHAPLQDETNINEITKLLSLEFEKRPVSVKYDAQESGRSTPRSRLSSKYRASVESAKQAIAERRSETPRPIIPSKSSLDDADLDENADMPFPVESIERSTSVGSSLHQEDRVSKYDKSTAVSRRTSGMASKQPSGKSSRTLSAAANSEGENTLKPASSSGSVPRASVTTPSFDGDKLGINEKSTSITPQFTMDRPTSYSIVRTPLLSEDQLVSSYGPPTISDHPIVQEYVKLYNTILGFKDSLAKILLDRDMMSASQILSDIEPYVLNTDEVVTPQIIDMGDSCTQILTDCGKVIDSTLQAAFREDYKLSSVVSAPASQISRSASVKSIVQPAVDPPQTRNTPESKASPFPRTDSDAYLQLQEAYSKLSSEYESEIKNHQNDIHHNAAVVLDLQETVAKLKREIIILQQEAEMRKTEVEQDPVIMFTRLDAERNAKNLKRAVSHNKLSEEQYQYAVSKMDAYVSLPARRFSELVKKYVHHRNMLRIEETIKNRNDIEDEDVEMLERMEVLQNMRSKRWMEKMDELAARRSELAAELMTSLEDLEQESGIFMIKPVFSYKAMLAAASLRQPAMGYNKNLLKPITQIEGAYEKLPPKSWPEAMSANSGAWNMQSSIVDSSSAVIPAINTPRILELDVNRMMYGFNQVTMKSNPSLTNDLLVNAANSSVRSYMTVSRPMAMPSRPLSSGALVTSAGDLIDTAHAKRADSAEAARRKSATPTLPPIAKSSSSLSHEKTFNREEHLNTPYVTRHRAAVIS